MTPELIDKLKTLLNRRVDISYNSCQPVPGTANGCLGLHAQGLLLAVEASYLTLQARDKSELHLPLDLIFYFKDVQNVEERQPQPSAENATLPSSL